MKPNRKYIAMFVVISVILALLSMTFFELRNLNQFFDASVAPNNKLESIETNNLKMTKIEVEQGGNTRIDRYVSVLSISRPALYNEQVQILQKADQIKPISDLTGHPSFLIQEKHEPFWKSQILMLHLFSSGGALFFVILSVAFAWIYFREGEKYFTRDIKRVIHGFFLLVLAGIVIYTFLYVRLAYFLNNEFNMYESLHSGISEMYEWTFLLLAVLFLYAFIEKAIPIQEEQDLTV